MAESANPTELLAATEVAATETTATEAPTDNESPKPEAAQDPVTENGKVASPVAAEEEKEEKEENLPSPPKPSTPKPLSPEHSSPKDVPATAPEQPPAEQTLAEQIPAEQTSVGSVNEPEVAADPLVAEAPASATAGSEVANANGDAEKENGERVVAEEKPHEKKEEDSIPPEGDSVVIPPHWHAKPCVHLTSIGGFVSEEFNMPSQASGQEDSINGEDRVISMTCSGLDKAINSVAKKLDGRLLLILVGLFISAHRNQVGLCLLRRYVLSVRSGAYTTLF